MAEFALTQIFIILIIHDNLWPACGQPVAATLSPLYWDAVHMGNLLEYACIVKIVLCPKLWKLSTSTY